MEIRKLEWDSEFFGLQIGRVDLHTNEEATELLAQRAELQKQFDLLYIFDPNDVGLAFDDASLVDEKIYYGKLCEPRMQYQEVSYYRDAVPSVDLYHLALVSGEFSRFRIDKQFPEGSYERLYTRWVENACPKEGTNKQILLIHNAEHVAKGMITIDHDGELGHIGLSAVDTDTQRQGIGTKIMSTLDGYLYDQGVKRLEVSTQKTNTFACKWYEKNGFTIQSRTKIYHWWLNPSPHTHKARRGDLTLYLMGEKGLHVLQKILPQKSTIVQVIGARDKNVQNDYYEDIKKLCIKNGIIFHDRLERVDVNSDYSIAIGWRWMIDAENGSKLIILHDSLLPRYRGFAPLVNMLINHEPKIGVTALFANVEFDRGDIIAQKSVDVCYPIRVQDAIEQVSEIYGELVMEIMSMISSDKTIKATAQEESEASYSLWRNEDDYAIDWNRDAEYIQQFVYSVGYPYKGASSMFEGVRYRILDCEIDEDVRVENRCPGKLLFMRDGCPVIVCGKGMLKITKLETEDGESCLPLRKYRVWFK